MAITNRRAVTDPTVQTFDEMFGCEHRTDLSGSEGKGDCVRAKARFVPTPSDRKIDFFRLIALGAATARPQQRSSLIGHADDERGGIHDPSQFGCHVRDGAV
nr:MULTISPECIES: hypothetical protein [unclassified Mycolicibacterium]